VERGGIVVAASGVDVGAVGGEPEDRVALFGLGGGVYERAALADGVEVDVSCGGGRGGEAGAGYADSNTFGLGLDEALEKSAIADASGHEGIGGRPLDDQVGRDTRAGSAEPLGGGAGVVYVEPVDFGSVLQEEVGDWDGASEVKGELSVSAAGVNEGGIGGDQGTQVVDLAQSSGGVRGELGAALEEIVGQLIAAIIKDAEAAGPPVTPLVDIGAELEQQVDHRTLAGLNGPDEGCGSEAVGVVGVDEAWVGGGEGADEVEVSAEH